MIVIAAAAAFVLQSCRSEDATTPPAPEAQKEVLEPVKFWSPLKQKEAEDRARALIQLGVSAEEARALLEEASFQEALDSVRAND